jgi:hypothetical protein
MIPAIRAEFLKLTTTRLWWILGLILIGYVAFTAALIAGLFGALGDQLAAQPDAPQLPPESLPPIVYSSTTAVGYVFPLILGTLAVTSEVRYQTLTPTFLAVPRRGRVLAAKLVVLAVTGAISGGLGLVASMGAGAPILAATGNDPGLGDPNTWLLAGRVILAMALWAVIGVGVGSLIQNQIAAIIVVLAFTQFVEPSLRHLDLGVDSARRKVSTGCRERCARGLEHLHLARHRDEPGSEPGLVAGRARSPGVRGHSGGRGLPHGVAARHYVVTVPRKSIVDCRAARASAKSRWNWYSCGSFGSWSSG